MAKTEAAKRKWLPLESDPEVFNRYAKALGCEHVGETLNFCDVFGLDPDLLGMVPRPVVAVILLFPIEKQKGGSQQEEEEEQRRSASMMSKHTSSKGAQDGDVFYIKQKIGNACGTIALLHAIANNTDVISLKEGSFLSNFVNDCREMSPNERAEYLEEKADFGLESAHNSAATEPTEAGSQTEITEQDMKTDLHFVCYVEKNGVLCELDGRSSCDVVQLSKCTKEDLLENAAIAIQKRMASTGSIRFNIMACTLAG